MNEKLRKFRWMLLVLLLPSFVFAQYREESGALEQIYESRVRSALNTILRTAEYSVVVAVEINQDRKQLDAIEEEMENMALPGIAGISMPESMSVSNKLHELRNRISVHLVLDDAVSKEKELAAKSLVNMKLHLDETAGDNLVVSRAGMIKEVDAQADLLPEISWRMWALAILLSLMGLGMLAMYLSARKKKTEDKKNQEPAWNPMRSELPELPENQLAAGTEETESEHEKQLIELYERKKSLIQLATKYPQATSKAMEEQFEKGHEKDVLLTCEHLGWEISRNLFSEMGHRTWSKLGSMMAVNTKTSTDLEVLTAIEHCHRSVIAKYLEIADQTDVEDPLGFLKKLNAEDLQTLVSHETAANLAAICACLDDSQKAMLIDVLSDDLQQATLLQLAKLSEVPHMTVKRIADSLRTRLRDIKENPTRMVNGQHFLVKLLGDLDVLAEEKFLKRMGQENPSELSDLRKVYLLFEDIANLPQDLLSEALGMVPVEVLTQALYSAGDSVRYHCFEALPEKRAKMIQKDISYIQTLSHKECLAAQRAVVKTIKSVLLMQGLELSQYLNSSNEEAKLAAA